MKKDYTDFEIKEVDSVVESNLKASFGQRLAQKIRNKLVERFPKFSYWLSTKKKGHCCLCGDCCRNTGITCCFLKDDKCSINDRKPTGCIITPFPTDLLFNPKYKRCTYYYPFQFLRKRRLKKENKLMEESEMVENK